MPEGSLVNPEDVVLAYAVEDTDEGGTADEATMVIEADAVVIEADDEMVVEAPG